MIRDIADPPLGTDHKTTQEEPPQFMAEACQENTTLFKHQTHAFSVLGATQKPWAADVKHFAQFQ